MNGNIMPISCEEDLELYKNQLKNFSYDKKTEKSTHFLKHLTDCKGKRVLVEICAGGCTVKKCGKLLDVGEDYIVIKTGNALVSTSVPIAGIHCVTVMHGM